MHSAIRHRRHPVVAAADDALRPADQPSGPARSARRRRPALAALVVGLGLVATACSSGPGTEAEFVEVLTRGGTLTDEEATCIAGEVFEEYGDDEDALGKISAAPSFEFLGGTEGVPGFTEFFEQTVQGCSAFGPTTG